MAWKNRSLCRARPPTRGLVRYAYPLLLATVVLLAVVLIPGIGSRAGGSSRWLKVAGFGFQPGELAKVAFVIYLACSLTKKREKIRAF
ncbi:MAG: FtsW/RodA/SpoVE family cell cycle protein, partial [Deltaproteobacteria bacterium]|nr:FtsW/RodA/SpoVE family cell cycle protein [Deltaproteobacteria bacterium]